MHVGNAIPDLDLLIVSIDHDCVLNGGLRRTDHSFLLVSPKALDKKGVERDRDRLMPDHGARLLLC